VNFREVSAKQLIEGYQSGLFKIHEVTRTVIQNINAAQPKLNALAEDRFRDALEEADAKQKAIELGQVNWLETPLCGLPVTIKEMLAIKGMRQTLGTLDRKDWISQADATMVARLKKLGAVILGTTNVSELGFWFECSNPVYGVTNNPIDAAYTSGGSSGGEAALVGAGMIPIGFGSDIGGSIRIPASFCGCLGYKPTPGILPLTGHFPATKDYWDQWVKTSHMTSLGFLSHHPTDIIWLTQLLSGHDKMDPASNVPPIAWDRLVSPSKVYLLSDPDFNGAYRADSEVVEAVENVGKYLEAMGFDVIRLPQDFFSDSLPLWLERAKAEKVDSFFNLLSPLKDRSIIKELLLKMVGKRQFEWPALVTATLESITLISDQKSNAFKSNVKKVHSLLGNHSVILIPTHPRNGIKHNQSLLRPFDFVYTAAANLYDLPAVQVPVAKSPKNRLPIGCQVWAHPFQDRLALSIAEIIHSTFKDFTQLEKGQD